MCMAEVSIADYAHQYGFSEQIVRKAARQGVLPARKASGVWLIDDGEQLRPQRSRPLAQRMAAALLSMIDGSDALRVALRPTERHRLDARLHALRHDEHAADVFITWFRPRVLQRPLMLFVQPADMADLRSDDRLVLGGVSDPRAEISAPDFLEAHVAEQDMDSLRREFLLRESVAPNVALHVEADCPPATLPLSTLLLDLATDGGPRERARLAQLLRGTKE
ncbi:hypothetical protein DEI82_05230 [Curtobacterium sp. MCBD17_019]|nr:hypothetical protein DEI82_05230 [Curtobacterium sp. MCBD17_019]